MTDQDIIQGLIERDNRVTKEFFFENCRPLFCSIMQKVFDHEVDYDEMVNELYVYLMQNDALKLRNFQFRSSVYQWLKVIAIRFFIKRSAYMRLSQKDGKRFAPVIDDFAQETPYDGGAIIAAPESDTSAEGDLERLFEAMPTKRYVYVIRRLVLEEWEPEQLAQEMNITTANLYNIKRRAMAQLIRTALSDIKEYGKQ